VSGRPLPTRHAGPADSPGFLLWRISNAWQREQRAALQAHGLTHTQFVALAVATWFGREGPLSQARLAQLTGSDPMTTSQVVRALEAAGHFRREPHPADSRAKAIVATASGRRLAAAALPAVEAVDEAFFGRLAPAERERLVQLFQRLAGPVVP
jgi:DNA-binding MarR family transcriptional regulator